MKVIIDYSDGQYTMTEAPDGWTTNVVEIDSRDWERYLEFLKVARGWDYFIRDLDNKLAGHTAYGPYK